MKLTKCYKKKKVAGHSYSIVILSGRKESNLSLSRGEVRRKGFSQHRRKEWEMSGGVEGGGGGGGGGGSRCRLLNSCTGRLNQRLTEPGPKISFTLSYSSGFSLVREKIRHLKERRKRFSKKWRKKQRFFRRRCLESRACLGKSCPVQFLMTLNFCGEWWCISAHTQHTPRHSASLFLLHQNRAEIFLHRHQHMINIFLRSSAYEKHIPASSEIEQIFVHSCTVISL